MTSGAESAPPVLLFQGSGANSAMWIHEIAAWAARFRVYAVDLIGEPGLSAPSRPPLASEAYALWLDDVLDGLGLTSVAMAGVSLGGWLALDYASRRPHRVERLALLAPGGIGRRRIGILVKAGFLSLFGERGRRWALQLAIGSRPTAPSPEGQEMVDFAVLVFRHFRPRMAPMPVLDDDALGRIAPPTLVVVGGRDGMLDTADTVRRLQHAAPHIAVHVVPEAGHVVSGQTERVLDFLAADAEPQPS